MSTYVISDIHGNLDVFKKLLNTINFSFEKDELILLGDYVDWGKDSLKTLLYVMELDEKYENVHVLIGNHDLMFLEQIKRYNKNEWDLDNNWLENNKGKKTWFKYLSVDKSIQRKIEIYLDTLDYQYETSVNGTNFIMAHAAPYEKYIYDDDLSEEENYQIMSGIRSDAVWERIIRNIPYIAQWYNYCHEENENAMRFDYFICGHTISNKVKDEHFSIDYIGDAIDIDCGAKILGHTQFEEESLARLAALRLDDFKEFYER